MVKATSIIKANEPYLTQITDEQGRTLVVNSSRIESRENLTPSQLLQAGLAGCMSMTVKGELFNSGLSYNDVTVTVDMIKDEDQTRFFYHVEVDSDEDPELVAAAKARAEARCYVRGILSSDIQIAEDVKL